MKLSKKASIIFATIAVMAASVSSRADDLVDCKDPEIQKMVRLAVEDWSVLNGFPKSTLPIEKILPYYAKATSDVSLALERKLESLWKAELTFCEAKVPELGESMFISGFMTTDPSGRIGGFIASFGAGAGIATFGGFDENLLR